MMDIMNTLTIQITEIIKFIWTPSGAQIINYAPLIAGSLTAYVSWSVSVFLCRWCWKFQSEMSQNSVTEFVEVKYDQVG